MENFYFDSSVVEGLDLLESMMSDVRQDGGRVWFTFVRWLSFLLTVYREELSETTFDPVVTVNAVGSENGGVEILGSITTYQKIEGLFSIVKVVVGEREYSRDPSSQMLLNDKKLDEEYHNWSFSDWIPDGDHEVEGSVAVEGNEEGKSDEERESERSVTVEGNDESENEEENSVSGSFVVSTSEIDWEDQGDSFMVSTSEIEWDSSPDRSIDGESEWQFYKPSFDDEFMYTILMWLKTWVKGSHKDNFDR
jgi:hypothetical protein